jgi:hypothetical protein
MMSLLRKSFRIKAAPARARFEELRRISDDFGAGAILRYGEDRYGSGMHDASVLKEEAHAQRR